MINNNLLAVYSSELLDTSEDFELKQRLGLYQVFLRLYEHHRGLLDEILELENSGSKTLSGVIFPYIQGIVQNQQAQLVTNLLGGKSQALNQPQRVWTIGRDSRQVILPIQDKRLSRCHAAIRYVVEQGFYIIDLDSSNGSFVNGERIRRPHRLKDGDRLRLGSLTITFFLPDPAKDLEPISADLLARLDRVELSADASLPKIEALDSDLPQTTLDPSPRDPGSQSTLSPEETLLFLQSNLWRTKSTDSPSGN
jgi:pSer/pThr/pTyr-binding forkhead associated (FHA) protein